MGFLTNIVRNAVSEGINKGISEAVGKAAEKIIAPKAEAYANKVADSLEEATEGLDAASKAAESAEPARKSALSSLEASLNRLSESAEKYAQVLEQRTAGMEAIAEEWKEKLPEFPIWCFGGHDFDIDELGTTSDGNPYYRFRAEGTTQEELDAYVALLREQGFVTQKQDWDDVLYKKLDGEYLVFSKTEAFSSDPVMDVVMYRTADTSEFMY